MKKKLSITLIIFILYFIINSYNIMSKKTYLASDFNIEVIKSNIDYNENGIDDFTDILNGAKKEALKNPKYKSAYYSGGYPPENEGVCTDVIWRSLKEAGYNLKELVDFDIKKNKEKYTNISVPDTNIDFRRVKNLKVFFDNHTQKLTLNIDEIEKWQPGDIVIFGSKHIAIISDKRNKKGIPYIIHNASNYHKKEEDALKKWNKKHKITGHYRFILS